MNGKYEPDSVIVLRPLLSLDNQIMDKKVDIKGEDQLPYTTAWANSLGEQK